MSDVFNIHEVARIRTGKYAGLVGTVTGVRFVGAQQTGVRVNVEGVKNGAPMAAHVWLKRSAIERNNHHGA